ncbi:MAG TPA: AraC family transcriptional regulator [Clostridiales bacterium]|nr:AraC family transcriptional regulator [Clostridiales bacterium]
MKTEPIIKNTHIQAKTKAPLYTEAYSITKAMEDDFHSHEFFEIGITLEGEAIHKTMEEEQFLQRCHVYLIPIGQSHSITVPTLWRVQNLYFLPRLIFQSLDSTISATPLLHSFLLKLVQKASASTVHFCLSEAATLDIECLLQAQKSTRISNQQLLEHYRSNCLLNILMVLCDAYFEAYPGELQKTDGRIPRLLSILHSTIGLPTAEIIHEISLELALNPQYLNKLVNKTFHTSLSNLILETKLEKSCQYLLGKDTITETAQALGFYDHSHYNKYFVRYFGISPSQYREKHLI